MIRALFVALWRVFILLLGTVIVWLTIFKFYPYADTRFPLFVIVVAIYAGFAYIVIPTLIRILRLFSKPNHIPRYAVTPDGWPSDPVNIAIITTSKDQLVHSMKRAGWFEADEPTLRNSIRAGYAMLFGKPYPEAPFSPLYLFGRNFDIGFQKPANPENSPRSRHHVRFWRLETPEDERHFPHFTFWHNKLKHLLGIKKEIWIGAAIKDTNIFGIRWRSGSLTHQISVDIDAERDLIISDLSNVRHVRTVDIVPAGETFSFRGQTIHRGGPLICDGMLTVIELRGRVKTSVLERLPKK